MKSWTRTLLGLAAAFSITGCNPLSGPDDNTAVDGLPHELSIAEGKLIEADFSGMCCGPGDLYIDEVKHKAFVEVNEEGTEAAAATSVGIAPTSTGPHYYLIDKPFVFVIREKYSGTILFMGKVLDPRS